MLHELIDIVSIFKMWEGDIVTPIFKRNLSMRHVHR